MGRKKGRFLGKQRPGQLPKRKRLEGGEKKKGSSLGLLGLLGSFAGAFVWGILRQRSGRQQAFGSDRALLSSMLQKPIRWSEHAVCRMDCRHIPKDQVMETLTSGKINAHKSDLRSQPCPKYVVDATIGSNSKNVQAVFSACPAFTNVVTVIDKDTNWECVCP